VGWNLPHDFRVRVREVLFCFGREMMGFRGKSWQILPIYPSLEVQLSQKCAGPPKD